MKVKFNKKLGLDKDAIAHRVDRRPPCNCKIVVLLVSALLVLNYCNPAIEITKQQIERDLALEVTLKNPKIVRPAEEINLDILLVNRSDEVVYPVVMPGDGSCAGWREPYVYFSAQLRKLDASWEEVPKARWGRCGLFDSNWQKDVIFLRPGDSFKFKEYYSCPSGMLELQQPGRIHLYVHYKYSAGRLRGDKATKKLGMMKGIPAFEITSNPIEFELVRPLDIRVRVKAMMKRKTKTKLSDILHVELVNNSKGLRVVYLPPSSDLRLEINGKFRGYWKYEPSLNKPKPSYGIEKKLRPGENVSLLGGRDFPNGSDGLWEYPEEGTVKLRAIYHSYYFKPSVYIMSNWVEVKVTGKE
jgi:hypothetical protein